MLSGNFVCALLVAIMSFHYYYFFIVISIIYYYYFFYVGSIPMVEPKEGLELTASAEIKNWTLKQLNHPGSPFIISFHENANILTKFELLQDKSFIYRSADCWGFTLVASVLA